MPKISIILCFIFAIPVFASDLSSQIDAEVQKILPRVIEWRRHIHQKPELGNREVKTAKFVAEHLKSLGIEVKTGIAHTGVVGILKGGLPGPVMGLRADMDALPLTEKNTLPFASKETTTYNGEKVGVMHACGHDSHVAWLMGTASVLSHMKDKIKGTVVFVFQPAEEGAPKGEEGGADLMIKEGAMDNPKIDVMFGAHVSSSLEIGHIEYKAGAELASADSFKIVVKGKGSHGAMPWAGVDPIVVSAQIIMGLQTIVSRQEDIAKAPVIITIGKIESGVRSNIIPEQAEMIGTIRTLDEGMHTDIMARITRTAEKIAESMGASAEFSLSERGYPVTSNPPDLVEKMLPSLQKAIGKENVSTRGWILGAEDFSFYGQKAPAFFFFIGGMPKGQDPKTAPPHHSPLFMIDDSRLDVGVRAFVNLVLDYPNAP